MHTVDSFYHAASSLAGKVAASGGAVAAGSGAIQKSVDYVTASPEAAERALDLSNFGIVAGVFVGFTGLIAKIFFEIRADRRAERLARAQIAKAKGIK